MGLTKKDKKYIVAVGYEVTSILLVPIGAIMILAGDHIVLGVAMGGIGTWGNYTFNRDRKRLE